MFPLLPRPYEIGSDIPKNRLHPRGWTYRTVSKVGAEMDLVGLTPHRLRNTYATLHHEMGTDLLILRRLLRHHSLLTTEKYIMRTSTKAMGDQLKFEDWIGLDPISNFREEFFGHQNLPDPVLLTPEDLLS
jgi:integrase